MRKMVQIVGAGPSIADWPVLEGAERWVFNSSHLTDQGRPYHRVFQLHENAFTRQLIPKTWAWCQAQDRPVYLLDEADDMPTGVRYPLAAVQAFFSTDDHHEQCFGCTVDYLIAFALYEGFDYIDLAGIECWWGNEEYAEQRASISYWMGRARGMGRVIRASHTSSLATVPALYGYNVVTGYPAPPSWERPIRGHKYSMLPESVTA